METAQKILGWFLLIVGLILVAYTLYNSYLIFTAQIEVPQFFKIDNLVIEQKSLEQLEIDSIIGDQLKSLIPVNAIPNLLNLISWSILAGILILGGTKISGIGIKLIKNSVSKN